MTPVRSTVARQHLKTGTDAAHRLLDIGMNSFDLGERDDYRDFLRVSAGGLLVVEDALDASTLDLVLPDWTERKRAQAILADIDGMGEQPPVVAPGSLAFDTLPAALGAAYVLEGSRLGARILIRRAGASDCPLVRTNLRYLSHGAGQPLWSRFLSVLEAEVQNPAALEQAQSGALAAFEIFQKALDAQLASARQEKLS